MRQGKIRYIGCSNWPAWKVATALGVSERRGYARFETVQAYYSLAGRDLEREMIPLLDHAKGGLLVWSPLAGGLLSGKFDRDNQSPEGSRRSGFDFPVVDKERAWTIIDALRPIADAHGCSPARVALRVDSVAAGGHLGHRRRETHGPAAGQSGLGRSGA